MNEPVWASWHEQANERTAARVATQQQARNAQARIIARRSAAARRQHNLHAFLDVALAVTVILCTTVVCFLVK